MSYHLMILCCYNMSAYCIHPKIIYIYQHQSTLWHEKIRDICKPQLQPTPGARRSLLRSRRSRRRPTAEISDIGKLGSCPMVGMVGD